MATTVRKRTIRDVANAADPNQIADVLRKVRFGDMLTPVKAVVAGLTAAASFDITTALFKTFCTITGHTLLAGENLSPILHLISLRVVTSGTAGSVGSYVFTDASGTALVPPGGASAAVGLALLSDDGKTITFPNTVTAFTLQYVPRAPASIGSINVTEFAAFSGT